MNFLTPIAKYIFQITLPLPFALNHVHCYLVDDGDGWTIIDAGLNITHAKAVWEQVLRVMVPYQLKRVIVTHCHPDHYGMAGWLQQWGQHGRSNEEAPPVLMSAPEHQFAQMMWLPPDPENTAVKAHLAHCGLDAEMVTEVSENVSFLRQRTAPHPHRIEYLRPGETIELGQRSFEILTGQGHSEQPLMFYAAADRLLFSGDHVLMEITPNIGKWHEGNPRPLASYLASLQELKNLDVRLALPGHKRVITNWSGRINELEAHHAQRLQDTVNAIPRSGASVEMIARSIFRLEHLTVHEARFAIAEALAHADYLVDEGQLRRGGDKVWLYYKN